MLHSSINNEVLDTIKARRSIRAYQDRQIPDDKLYAILEAGQHAPNTSGDEPWHFTVVQNRDILMRLNRAAKEAARMSGVDHLIALGRNHDYDCLYGAPTLVLVSGDESGVQPEADCAAAVQNMLLAAESIGLGTCWIYFVLMAFQSSAGAMLRMEVKIPEGYKPIYAFVLGYKASGSPDAPPRKKDKITMVR